MVGIVSLAMLLILLVGCAPQSDYAAQLQEWEETQTSIRQKWW